MNNSLERLLDEQRIKSLLTRERYYRDTAQWQNLRDSYHPDSSKTAIKITWYDGDVDGFVSGSEEMAQHGASSSHTICPVEIHFNNNHDKAVSESTGSINSRFRIDENEYNCASYARFVSRLEKVNGEWKMLTLEAIYDRDTIAPVLPMVSTSATFDIEGHRDSYRCIGWLLAGKGFQVNLDLPGTDRPESVTSFMNESFAWLKAL